MRVGCGDGEGCVLVRGFESIAAGDRLLLRRLLLNAKRVEGVLEKRCQSSCKYVVYADRKLEYYDLGSRLAG